LREVDSAVGEANIIGEGKAKEVFVIYASRNLEVSLGRLVFLTDLSFPKWYGGWGLGLITWIRARAVGLPLLDLGANEPGKAIVQFYAWVAEVDISSFLADREQPRELAGQPGLAFFSGETDFTDRLGPALLAGPRVGAVEPVLAIGGDLANSPFFGHSSGLAGLAVTPEAGAAVSVLDTPVAHTAVRKGKGRGFRAPIVERQQR